MGDLVAGKSKNVHVYGIYTRVEIIINFNHGDQELDNHCIMV